MLMTLMVQVLWVKVQVQLNISVYKIKLTSKLAHYLKPLSVVGGYVAGSKQLIDWLKAQSRPFLFSTSLAPGDTKAITEAVKN